MNSLEVNVPEEVPAHFIKAGIAAIIGGLTTEGIILGYTNLNIDNGFYIAGAGGVVFGIGLAIARKRRPTI